MDPSACVNMFGTVSLLWEVMGLLPFGSIRQPRLVPMDRAMALAHWKQRAEAAPKHQSHDGSNRDMSSPSTDGENEILEVLRSQSRSEQLC